MDVKEIIKEYHDTCRKYQLSDEFLKEEKCKTRTEIPTAAEFYYGIVFLQDAAVDVLIKRIEGLETELQELRETAEHGRMAEKFRSAANLKVSEG